MNQEASGWGWIFSFPCWVWLNHFSTFSTGLWVFRSPHSLSCFPNASSSFTITCVNHPEETRHSCQDNILLMKQENVFSLWVVWIAVISMSSAQERFSSQKCWPGQSLHSWCAATCTNWNWDTHPAGGNLTGLTFSCCFSKIPTKPKVRLYLDRARNGCTCSSLKWLKTTVYSKVTWLWGTLETQSGLWG